MPRSWTNGHESGPWIPERAVDGFVSAGWPDIKMRRQQNLADRPEVPLHSTSCRETSRATGYTRFVGWGWRERSEELYALAAEVTSKSGQQAEPGRRLGREAGWTRRVHGTPVWAWPSPKRWLLAL